MYRYSLLTSVLNRATGLILSLGLLALTYWLMALAGGPESYERAAAVLSHPLARLLFAGLLVSFVYHLLGGIRHLVWDTGAAMEREQSRRSAWLLGFATVLLTLILGYYVFFAGAAS